MAAARFRVRGKVQGVWFRASTQAEAERIGIHAGHALNLADGSVEVVAMGEAAALDALAVWLQAGPPLAEVEAVEREAIDESVIAPGFRTG